MAGVPGITWISYNHVLILLSGFFHIVIYFSMSDIISRYLSNPSSSVDSAYLYSFIITVLWIVVGGAAVTYYYSRNRPRTLEKAGEFDVEESA